MLPDRRPGASSALLLLVLALLVVAAGPAEGVIIHESATLGPIGQTSGWTAGPTQFLGSRFHVNAFVKVTAVGGHLWSSLTVGNQLLFAAIVALTGPAALPSGKPFDDGTLLAVTTFDPGFPSSDILTPLSVTLAPGDYALIFGSGLFGATGDGAMAFNNPDIPGQASYFTWRSLAWLDGGISNVRFVVVGQILGGTADFALSPPSGTYLDTQGFDLALIVEAFGLFVTGVQATLNGTDVTATLRRCVPGHLLSGGQTFRCPRFARHLPGPGTHTLTVILELSNGSKVIDAVTWNILANSEP